MTRLACGFSAAFDMHCHVSCFPCLQAIKYILRSVCGGVGWGWWVVGWGRWVGWGDGVVGVGWWGGGVVRGGGAVVVVC